MLIGYCLNYGQFKPTSDALCIGYFDNSCPIRELSPLRRSMTRRLVGKRQFLPPPDATAGSDVPDVNWL